jgi:hypothetical protein
VKDGKHSPDFGDARSCFGRFRIALQSRAALRLDVEQAFAGLLGRYSTSIRENRFVVGGVAEIILGTALAAAGIPTVAVGHDAREADLLLMGTVRVSVKASLQASHGAIRLINVLGTSADTTWDVPLLVIASGLGVGYADPVLLPEATRRRPDVLELPFGRLRALWRAQPEYLCGMSVPVALQDPARSEVASRALAREIIRASPSLAQHLDDVLRPSSEGRDSL